MCSNAQQSRQILQNITKIHLPYARVEIYKVRHCINCGCVCLSQNNSPSKATHCTFTSNNAEHNGGAICAWVGHPIQDVTVLGNRSKKSNCTVLYYKFLELLVFLLWIVTTLHQKYFNIWSGIDPISAELV